MGGFIREAELKSIDENTFWEYELSSKEFLWMAVGMWKIHIGMTFQGCL